MLSHLVVLACTLYSVSAATVSAATSPVHLAKSPTCGAQGSPAVGNSGLSITGIKTIYAFGDSWMSNGQSNGGKAPEPVFQGSSPKAGGRACDRYVWPEYLAQQTGATLKDYAVGGAMIDRHLWRSRENQATSTDMVAHVNTYISQKNSIDAASTLCVVSYGINDYAASSKDGTANLAKAADAMIEQIQRLAKSGLRKFVVVSPPYDAPALRAFDARVMDGLKRVQGVSTAYVEIISLFNAILASPTTFGYVDTNSCCVSQDTIQGSCKDPGRHLYFVPRHPATVTHKIIAEWILKALGSCKPL